MSLFVMVSGARMLQHSNSANEMLLRRKLEEQQQAAELQQAIELHSRRLMGLQLLDLKSRAAAAPTPIGNPFSASQTAANATGESPPDSGRTWCIRPNDVSPVAAPDAVLLMFTMADLLAYRGAR